MTFLNPFFLIGISAFALPLIIHLIFKKKAKIVPFPSIVFLREIDREIVRRKRVEEVIVMILRMLVLVLLALFLSKPVLKTNLLGGGRKAVVIILDDSFSMNAADGRRRFDLAKEKARLLIANLEPADTAALILSSRSPEDGFKNGILSTDRVAMTQWLSSLDCGYSSSNLDTAFSHATTLLRFSKTKNRGIFFITDLQRRDWQSIAGKEKTSDIPLAVIVVAGDSTPLNAAITKIETLSTPEKRLGKNFTFRIETTNFSPRPFQGRIGMYSLEDEVIAETQLSIPPHSTVEKELRFNPVGEGWHSGYFLIEKDDLPTDNKRYYSLQVKEGTPVAVFNQVRLSAPDFDEVFFLTKLIDPTGQNYPFAPSELFVISSETLAKYPVVIFPELPKLREGEMSALKSYLNSGGRAVLFLKENFPVETMRTLLGDILAANRFEEGIFRVAEEGFGLQNLFVDVDFYRRISLSVSGDPSIVPISLFQDGKPFLVEKSLGSGKLILFATGYHIDYTNLPLTHASLPFIYNLLFRLTGKPSSPEYVVGDSVIIRPDWASITAPSGDKLDLSPDSAFFELNVPGIYQVMTRTSSTKTTPIHLSVNLDPQEGDLTPIASDADIGKVVPFTRWERIRSDEDIRAKLQAMITGTPLWNLLLYAAILAFLMELYLANKIGQKV